MTTWLIGDVQGCYDGLYQLLSKIQFNPAKDRLWFAGDLVNRGGQSLEVLRWIHAHRARCSVVLGNHDLALLMAANQCDKASPGNREFQRILNAVDGPDLVHWLGQQPLAHHAGATLMIHAGLAPSWGVKKTLRLAAEVEVVLRSDRAVELLNSLWNRRLSRWSSKLTGMDRLGTIVNILTRARYCRKNGSMDFKYSDRPGTQPENLTPWYEHPDRKTLSSHVVFGHWSRLGYYHSPAVTCLDSGYVWGRQLSAVRLKSTASPVQVNHPSPTG